jgi:Probable cobalt transporter subunit (CbtB)
VNHSATPAPIPVADLLPALLLAAVLLLVVYLVQFDQGALSRMGALMHELMHDGRHVLGVPCH